MIKNKFPLKKIIILVLIIITTILMYQKFIKKDFPMTRLIVEGHLTSFITLWHMDYEEGSLLSFHDKRCNAGRDRNDEMYDSLLQSCGATITIRGIKELYASNRHLFKFMEIYEKECNEEIDISCRAFSTLVYFANKDKLQKYIQQKQREFDLTSNIHSVPEYNPFSYKPEDAMPSVVSSCIKDKLEFLGYEFISTQKCPEIDEVFPQVKEDIYSEMVIE